MARNPFRSEAEAYRFLLLTVGYFALIVVAAAIATWLGVVVFVVLTAAAVWLWLRSRPSEPALKPSASDSGPTCRMRAVSRSVTSAPPPGRKASPQGTSRSRAITPSCSRIRSSVST